MKFISPLIKHLILAFRFMRKNLLYYLLYVDVSFVKFFTRNRIGFWFYFLTVTLMFREEQLTFFSPSIIFIRSIIGISIMLALLAAIAPFRKLLEKQLRKEDIDYLFQDSPISFIINALKPFLFIIFLQEIISYGELAQKGACISRLQDIYGAKWEDPVIRKMLFDVTATIVAGECLGIKGAFLQFERLLLGNQQELSFFLLLSLIFIILLQWLKRKQIYK